MTSLNKTILIGNVGKNPQISYLENGTCVAKFSIATSDTWKDKSGDKREESEWHRIVFFGRFAEICAEYVKKGMKVYIEGKIKTRKWQDKETGKDKYATDIVGNVLKMLSYKKCESPSDVEEIDNDKSDSDIEFDSEKRKEENIFDEDFPF